MRFVAEVHDERTESPELFIFATSCFQDQGFCGYGLIHRAEGESSTCSRRTHPVCAARLAVTAARAAHVAATANGGQGGDRSLLQLSHSACYAHAETVAAVVCPHYGPAAAIRGGVSATPVPESNCSLGALEGLGGLETRPRTWFPRSSGFLDRRVLHGRPCGSRLLFHHRS